MRDEIVNQIRSEKRPGDYEPRKIEDLRVLYKKDNWSREDRTAWESALSERVSYEISYQTGLQDYRSQASSTSPSDDAKNPGTPEPPKTMRYSEINKLSQDMKSGTKLVEYDCEQMSVTEGSVLQLIENELLKDFTGEKSPATYYYATGATYNADDFNKNGNAGGHAWIISGRTGNPIESTVRYSGPYNKLLIPVTMDQLAAGAPQLYMYNGSAQLLTAGSAPLFSQRTTYLKAHLDPQTAPLIAQATVEYFLDDLKETQDIAAKLTQDKVMLRVIPSYPENFNLIKPKISAPDLAKLEENLNSFGRKYKENVIAWMEDQAAKINRDPVSINANTVEHIIKNRNLTVENISKNPNILSADMLKDIRQHLEKLDTELETVPKRGQTLLPMPKEFQATAQEPRLSASAIVANMIADKYKKVLKYPDLIGPDTKNLTNYRHDIVAIQSELLNLIDPQDRGAIEKPRAEISAVIRDQAVKWSQEHRKDMIERAQNGTAFWAERGQEKRNQFIGFIQNEKIFCTDEDRASIRAHIQAYDATLKAYCKIANLPVPELIPIDPTPVRTTSVCGSDIEGEKLGEKFRVATEGIRPVTSSTDPNPTFTPDIKYSV